MKKKNDTNIYTYKIIFIIIAIIIIFQMIYAYSTKTNKIITIKNLNYFRSSNKGYNLILDTNNNTYQITNSTYYLFFTSAELYQELEINKTYNITYYGFRIPFMSMYPIIISATKIES